MEDPDYQNNINRAHLFNLITFIISLAGDIVLFVYGIVASCLEHTGLLFAMYSLPALLGLPTLFFIHYFLEVKIDQVEAQEFYVLISGFSKNTAKDKDANIKESKKPNNEKSNSKEAHIERIKYLYVSGFISKEEYERRKNDIMKHNS